MRILAFDTSTELCTAALSDSGRWMERTEHAGSRHSELLLPMIRGLLGNAGLTLRDLDGIAFGAGPGSFTGLRIACGVAQGLSFGADLPVVGVASLEAMAEAAYAKHGWRRVAAALDARMQEIYFAAYVREGERWRADVDPCVVAPADVTWPGGCWSGAGKGFGAYPLLVERVAGAPFDECIVPSGVAVGTLALPRLAAGEAVAASAAAPLYVRHRVALTMAERDAGQTL